MLSQFFADHWGDIASVAGVLISIVGFVITIFSVVRSKRAAQRAEEAAREVKDTILRADTMMELSAAITIMEEIKRLHRVTAWGILLDRYSSLKRLLISIRSANSDLPDEHKAALQSAIQHFTDIEKKVERALAFQHSPPNVATLNEIVSTQLDKINDVLAGIKQRVGVEQYGRPKAS